MYNFQMIKTFAKRSFGLSATNARLAAAFLVSVACDLGAVIILLVVIALLGKVAGPRLEEFFEQAWHNATSSMGCPLRSVILATVSLVGGLG